MALPPGVTTCIVTFGSPASGFNGEDVATTLNITPSHSVYHATTGAPLLAFSIQASAGEGLPGSVALPHTDQAGFLDASGNAFTNWAYTAEGTWRSGGATIAFKKNFQLPTGQQTVDLDLIPNGTIGLPVTAPTVNVTSFLGKTGAIEEEDLADLELGGGLGDAGIAALVVDPQSELNASLTATYAPVSLRRDVREFLLSGETLDGTGATNMQPIFARAVAAAAHPLGVPVQLIVPAGRFRLNTSIPWVSKVGLAGAGRTETVLVPYGTACAIEALTAIEWDGTYIDDVTFTDFGIDGSNQADSAYNASIKGFFIQNMRRARFERVNVEHTWGTGFGVDFLQDAWFSDCYASDCGRGWKVIYSLTNPAGTGGNGSGSGFGIGVGRNAVETCTMSNCVAIGNWVNGFFTEQLHNRGAEFKSRGYSMVGCVARGNKTGFLDAGSENALVTGCQFLENYYAGVQLGITIAEIPGAGYGGVVSGCVIARNGNPATGSGANVVLNDARNGRYTFDSNVISDSYGPGVWGNSSGTLGPDMAFTRNRIRGNAKAGMLIQMVADVLRLKIADNDISNNCVDAAVSEKAGVSLLCGLIAPAIVGNTIYDDRATKFQDRGIDIRVADRALSLPRIQFNNLSGNGVEGLRNQRTPSTTDFINNNIVSEVPDTQAPTAPTALTATSVGTSTAHLAWTASTDNIGVTFYEIVIGGIVVATSTASTYDLTSLTAGTGYSVTVRGVDAAGNRSAASNAATFTTQALGFADDFNAADGSAVGRVTPTGAKALQVIKGTSTVGTPTIESNRLRIPDAGGTVFAAWDSGTVNGTFKATLAYIDSDCAALLASHMLDINNRIYMGRVSSTVKNWQISQTVNSTVTLLFESAVPIASGDVVEMIWSGGTTLTVKINTVTIWTGTVSQHATRTLAGVGCTAASHEALWDDVSFVAA